MSMFLWHHYPVLGYACWDSQKQ